MRTVLPLIALGRQAGGATVFAQMQVCVTGRRAEQNADPLLPDMDPSKIIFQAPLSHLRRACSPAASRVPLTLGLLTTRVDKAKLQAILPTKIRRSFSKYKISF